MIRKQRGFTLIELLVVVSIIALLISILLPSLKKAREQAKAAACIANLKGLATASVTYSTDDEHENAIAAHPIMGYGIKWSIPHGTILSRLAFGFGGKSGRAKAQMKDWHTSVGMGPGTRPLNRSLYKSGIVDYSGLPYGSYKGSDQGKRWADDEKLKLGQFECPSDSGYPGTPLDWSTRHNYMKNQGLTAYDAWGSSFTISMLWTGFGPGTRLDSNSAFLRPLSRVPSPANTLYYKEDAASWAHYVAPQPDDCEDSPDTTSVIKGWHKRDWFFQASFCDAHAETVKIHGVTSPAPRLGGYPQDICGGDDVYMCYHCITIRGDGWQIDTLPAPGVETDLIWP